tara:strand:+ start:1005 stop:1586 length:582 start_codon:yes stop_codon:yes gene_type:complete
MSKFETNQVNILELNSAIEYIDTIWCAPWEGEWELHSCYILSPTLQKDTFEIQYQMDSTYVFEKQNTIPFDTDKFDTGMTEYNTLKKQLIQNNIKIVLIGVGITYAIIDINYSVAFLYGGITSLIYLFLLEKETDTIANKQIGLLTPLYSSGVRLLLITCISIQYITNDHAVLLPFLIGFFTYKIAVYLSVFF